MPTLEQLHHRAVKFPDPTARFNALSKAFMATEDAVAYQSAQHKLRGHLEVERRDMHPEDAEDFLFELRVTAEETFPRVFRGGFLVSLWSLFESGLKDLGEYARQNLSQPFGLQDIRAGDFLDQSEKYFRGALGIEVFESKIVRKKVELIKGFRNALAHHDGNLAEIPKILLTAKIDGEQSIQRFSDLHHDFGIPTAQYNAESLNLLGNVSHKLARKVYAKLHPGAGEA